jgi:glycerophosphoryl diester phosphodiesterase
MEYVAYRGLVNKNCPENSKKALVNAIKAGFSCIEIDIRCTQDGHFVIVHNEKLSDLFTFSSQEPIRSLPLSRLHHIKYKESDEKLLFFEDLLNYLQTVKKPVRVFVDIKDELTISEQKNLSACIKKYGTEGRIFLYPLRSSFGAPLSEYPIGVPHAALKNIPQNIHPFVIGLPHEWNKDTITTYKHRGLLTLTTIKKNYFLRLNQDPNDLQRVRALITQFADWNIDYLIIDSHYFSLIAESLNKGNLQ